MEIILIINIIVIILSIISIILLLYKIPYISNDVVLKDDELKISVIIPARNEEFRISTLLESLNKQNFKNFELIVVDDSSEDKTSVLSKNHGAKVINLKKLPKGWTGKTWACWNGALAAKGTILIFLDADTKLNKNGLENMISEFLLNYKEGALSIQPHHSVKKLYENFSVIFNIVVMIGMNVFSLFGNKLKPKGSFGSCLIIGKNAYLKIGGHKAVNTEILEDMAIGINLLKNKLPLGCISGKGTISFKMYSEGIGELINGWSKNFASGAKYTSKLNTLLLSIWFTGGICSIILLFIAIFSQSILLIVSSIIFYLIYALVFILKGRSIGDFNIFFLFMFPIPLIFFIIIFLRSILLVKFKHNVDWKGRKIDL
ncbi:MAG: glycosyltransferase family 2 protein [Clostridiales bacterium]